jgi:hypothetical protein
VDTLTLVASSLTGEPYAARSKMESTKYRYDILGPAKVKPELAHDTRSTIAPLIEGHLSM